MPKAPPENLRRYEKAREIARYYGFSPLSSLLEGPLKGRKLNLGKEGVPGEAKRQNLLEAYVKHDLGTLPQPLLLYHSEPLPKQLPREKYGGAHGVLFSLEIIGSGKSIAEAILFKTASIILEELGFEKLYVELNSLGDRESIARFSREFSTYCGKHAADIPGPCRAHLKKKDVFRTLECMNSHEKCSILTEAAPKPMGSLSEASRTHFSEALEYLESMRMPYAINHCLVGGKDFYTKTIFEIHTEEPESRKMKGKLATSLLAKGGRYDDLSKKFGAKKEVPAVGISLSLGGLGLAEPKKEVLKPKAPAAYLIQLGFDAKLQSLAAIEVLRQARIPVLQALPKDRMSAQIMVAEKMAIPYTIIIGQKEALEGSAIVRHMKTRSQETIPLPQLPAYLRQSRR